MKRLLLATIIAIAANSMAMDLKVNGNLLKGADVTSITATDGRILNMTTRNGTLVWKPYESAPYERGWDISSAEWSSTAHIEDSIIIPKGKAIASKFKTNASLVAYGTFNFETPTGGDKPFTRLWISKTPGGSPLSSRCERERATFVYSLNWSIATSTRCVLKPLTEYYINLQHVNPDKIPTKVLRTLTKARQ